jgi:hypothetical protein
LELGDRRDRAGPGTRSGVLVAVGNSSVVRRPRLSSSETFGQLAQGLRAALTIENFEPSVGLAFQAITTTKSRPVNAWEIHPAPGRQRAPGYIPQYRPGGES